MKIARRALLLTAVMVIAACSHDPAGITGGAPAVATKLAFMVQPGNTTAGVAFKPAVAVTIEDSSGHTVMGATNAVTVALDSAGMPSDTTTVKAVNGVATFENLSIQSAGSGYTLTASSGSLTRATSAPFTITPAAPARLIVTTQASTSWETQPITPAIQVTLFDAFNNLASNATNAVTLAIGKNPGGGTLTGATTVNAVNGVATFSNLSIDKPGGGYTLVATALGLASAETAPFIITGIPASIIKVGGDGQSGLMGCQLPAPLVVQVKDGNNQPLAGVAVRWARSGPGAWGAWASTTGMNGLASTYWGLAWSWSQALTASVTNAGSVTFYATGRFHDGPCPSGPPPPTIGLSPSSVTFTAPRDGADPAPQTVSVTNGGSGSLNGLAVGTISYVTDTLRPSPTPTGWLSASLDGSTAPATLKLNATTGTLPSGTYTAYVPVTSSVATTKAVTVMFTVQ